MAIECNDFTFKNKKISELNANYIFVNFDDNAEIILGLSRDMERGESNRYRTEPNYFYDTWSEQLKLEFNICKNPCMYNTQNDLELTENDIREISRWLTSAHFPEWLTKEKEGSETLKYHGWFDNIETWTVGHTVYGLRLYFTCTSPFAYTEEIMDETSVLTYEQISVNNSSDELESYCYPTIEIYPNDTDQIYMCNLSDSTIRQSGILELTQGSYFDSMLDIVETHALLNGCAVEYIADKDSAFNITPLCNDTAVQFYLVDRYETKTKCTAFYMADTKKYRIVENGFMHMTVYKDSPVYMDCQRLIINDDIGRMITYDKLGIFDVAHMYWLRLKDGDNTLLLYGNCNFTIKHIESRKVGE